MRPALKRQIDYLKDLGYFIEYDEVYVYVRKELNGSLTMKLQISWLGTVSDRSVGRLARMKAKKAAG